MWLVLSCFIFNSKYKIINVVEICVEVSQSNITVPLYAIANFFFEVSYIIFNKLIIKGFFVCSNSAGGVMWSMRFFCVVLVFAGLSAAESFRLKPS